MKTVLVDIYGADCGAEPIIRGALDSLKQYDDLKLCFFGDREVITKVINQNDADLLRIEIVHTTDYVGHRDNPAEVFKGRDQSSLVMALNRLKSDDNAVGLLSPGNTGALLVGGIFRLGLVKGLKTPALCSVMPIADGKMTALLDCGANIDCSSDDLVNFALMGSALMKSLGHSESPKVALMSLGREDKKGNKLTLEAFEKLSASPVSFIGNIEGLDAVSGEADVIVTDGFSGNVLMKTIEAVGKFSISAINDQIEEGPVEAKPCLEKVKARLENALDFNPRGGATFLGTVKPIIKMHGCATQSTPKYCIEQLIVMEQHSYRQALKDALER